MSGFSGQWGLYLWGWPVLGWCVVFGCGLSPFGSVDCGMFGRPLSALFCLALCGWYWSRSRSRFLLPVRVGPLSCSLVSKFVFFSGVVLWACLCRWPVFVLYYCPACGTLYSCASLWPCPSSLRTMVLGPCFNFRLVLGLCLRPCHLGFHRVLCRPFLFQADLVSGVPPLRLFPLLLILCPLLVVEHSVL